VAAKSGLPERPWTVSNDGLLLTVRVTPKGGRDAIDGIAALADGMSVLKGRVRAAASEGEANAALLRVVAVLLVLDQPDRPPSKLPLSNRF